MDELLTAVEDHLASAFGRPPPAGPAAWAAALALAGQQPHLLGGGRLGHLAAAHFMRHVWALLCDEGALAAAAAGAGVLAAAVGGQVRDRLVALVALADQDLTGGD